MKRRAGAGYGLSVVLPAVGLGIVMLRSFDASSRWVGLGLWLLGWVALVFAIRRHPRATAQVEKGRRRAKGFVSRFRNPLLSTIALLGSVAVALTLMPADEAVFLGADPGAVETVVQDDLVSVQRYRRGLQGLAGDVATWGELGPTPTAEDKAAALAVWSSHLDYAVALDRLIQTHGHFYQIDSMRLRELNAQSFLVGYAALVTQLEATERVVRAVGDNRSLETILDEPRPEFGRPAGAYFRLKQQLTRPANLLRLAAGRVHLEAVRKAGRLQPAGPSKLAAELAAAVPDLARRLGEDGRVFVDNPLDVLENTAHESWFPMQKRVAETMGNLRTTRRSNFVSPSQLEQARTQLVPGDVLLERRNWYVSNVGLPGFWPHAALYTGTLEEMDAYFGPEARKGTGGVAPSDFIARAYPAVARSYREPDAEGHAKRVIEAIGEGVLLTSLEHSGDADYLGAMRVRVTKEERLMALMRAFSFHARPYDYDFDFMTDGSIVCSELVYKAYQPLLEKSGRGFELTKTSGRFVLPPNDLARRLDADLESATGALDFVLFLDGSEERGEAVPADVEAFRQTWRRPKWDIAQQ